MKRPKSQSQILKRIVFSVPTVLVLAVIVGVVAVAAGSMYDTYRRTNKTVKRLETRQSELSARLKAAQNAAAEISTRRGLREQIRSKFSVVKPGERVIVLNDSRTRRQATTTSEKKDKGFFGRWLGIDLPL
jgi:transposase